MTRPPSLEAVVVGVCRLPLDFYALRTVSAEDLVHRSGYPVARSEVSAQRLAACLREHPDWVEEWFRWSADNRGSPAWYLLESKAGEFLVGFYDGAGNQPPEAFTDKTEAAAEFVHRYLDQVVGVSGESARTTPTA